MGDLISREATIDTMENTDWYHQNQNGEMVHGASSEDQAWYKAEDVYGVLERMSSVHPEQEGVRKRLAQDDWTPCSRDLPEEEGSYLVTDDAGGMKTVQDDVFFHYEDGTSSWVYSQNVTAWKPLPEPYRGEQDDEMGS